MQIDRSQNQTDSFMCHLLSFMKFAPQLFEYGTGNLVNRQTNKPTNKSENIIISVSISSIVSIANLRSYQLLLVIQLFDILAIRRLLRQPKAREVYSVSIDFFVFNCACLCVWFYAVSCNRFTLRIPVCRMASGSRSRGCGFHFLPFNFRVVTLHYVKKLF